VPINTTIFLAFALAISPGLGQDIFIPTSEVVRVASMAARDEGYDPNAPGMYLDELRTKDGKEPIKGYSSIALYKHGQIVRSYSIRAATGDVVDATECKIFRYPDLLRFKRSVLMGFENRDTSIEAIASEVGCDRLDVVPNKALKPKEK
jgi:hypothetical protein